MPVERGLRIIGERGARRRELKRGTKVPKKG
jgi:hypothetical protein